MNLQQLRKAVGQEININNKVKIRLEGIKLHDEMQRLFTLIFRQNNCQIKIPSQYVITFNENILHISIDPKIFVSCPGNFALRK